MTRSRGSGHLSDRYTDHMTRIVTISDAKAHLLSLIDDVIEGEEITITRHGRTVARLVAANGGRGMRGALLGVAIGTGEDEELFTTGVAWDLP